MNRRGFLSTLLGTGAALADPDLLKWVPGRKTISIPRPSPALQMRVSHLFEFDEQRGVWVQRLDILYGWGILKPEFTWSVISD